MRLAVGLWASLGLAGFSQAFALESTPPAATPQDQPSAASPDQGARATTVAARPAAAVPSSPAAGPAAATPAASTAAATTQPGSAATQPGSAAATRPGELTALEKRLLSQGYKLEMHKDLKYFCRTEAPLGSRFEHKTCQTEAQIQATTQTSKDTTKQLQSPTGSFAVTPGR
jgi:hypothetical protein